MTRRRRGRQRKRKRRSGFERSGFQVCFKRIPSQTLNKCSALSPFSKPSDLKQKENNKNNLNVKSFATNRIKAAAPKKLIFLHRQIYRTYCHLVEVDGGFTVVRDDHQHGANSWTMQLQVQCVIWAVTRIPFLLIQLWPRAY